MPTYELSCRSCGERFDKFLPRLLRDDDLVCPICGSRDIQRGVGGGMLGSGTRGSRGASTSPTPRSCSSSGFS